MASGRTPKFTKDSYVDAVGQLNGNLQVIEEFKNVTTPIKHFCTRCHNVWNVQPRQVLSGKKCLHCFRASITFTARQFEEKLQQRSPDFKLTGSYTNNYTTTNFAHSCGFEFAARPDRMMRNIAFCRGCMEVKTKDSWAKPVINQYGEFQSKIEAECGEWLFDMFGSSGIDRYKPYDTSTQRNCDFYIKTLDLWIEVSTINKDWYLERIFKKRKLVKRFVFASSLDQLKDLVSSILQP